MAYHFLEHTADLKFVAEGKTIEEAFVESSNALKEAICGDIIVLEQKIRNIKIKATGIENLVYKFLEEFIFLLESEDFLIAKVNEIKIDLKNFELDAKILGDKSENYKFTNDVKAVTYNEMFIKNEGGRWTIQVVLDV